MKVTPLKAFLLWLVAVAAGVAWVVLHTRFTADMSFFLPSDPSPEQRVLVGQMKDGSVSRLLMIGIEGGTEAERVQASGALRDGLASSGLFVSVQNGEADALEAERDVLLRYRYHLSPALTPERLAPEGLREAVDRAIGVAVSPVGFLFKPYLLQDPTGEMIEILAQLHPGSEPDTRGGVWASRDGQRALLLAQTRAPGGDTDGQAQAINTVRAQFAALQQAHALDGLSLSLSGPGMFAVQAREDIRSDIERISLISSIGIGLLLLWIYRSPRMMALGLLPVVAGTVAAIVAVDLVFGMVHGITVGFGAALIGESVDYAIYFFVQSGRVGLQAWRETFWPTIRLGVVTSIAGFGVMLWAGFPGLAQLGVYALSGIAVAALVTRFVLPVVAGDRHDIPPPGVVGNTTLRWLGQAWRLRWPAWILTAVALLYLVQHHDRLWSTNLSALSTVTEADAQADARLRTDIGAPDARYMVLVAAGDRESALRQAEAAGQRLDRLVDEGLIGGYDSPVRFLPSEHTQRQRLDALPPREELQRRLTQALQGAPLSAERLTPFLDAVAAARQAPPMTRADLAGTAMSLAVDAMMSQADGQWNIVLPLRPPATGSPDIPADAVRQALAGTGAVFIDLKLEFETLYADYLQQAVYLALGGVLAITAMLAFAMRSWVRIGRMVLTLAMTVIMVMAALHALGTELNLLHLIGLLLIVAVGSNYTLFFDQIDADGGLAVDVWSSMSVAVVTTVIGFGALAASTAPVLKAMGTTVAPGVVIALLLAAAFIVPRQGKPA
ncbi:MAG: MMPL family transporter [Hydrogenophaga sp.]